MGYVDNQYKTELFPWGKKPNDFVVANLNCFKQGSLLDLGTGGGLTALYLASKGFSVIGIDENIEAIDSLNHFSKNLNLKIQAQQSNIEDFKYTKSYDNILALFVLHLLKKENAVTIIENMKKHTEIGGTNCLVSFTKGSQYDMETKGELFYFDKEELLKIYKGWEILNIEQKETKTVKQTIIPALYMIARKIS